MDWLFCHKRGCIMPREAGSKQDALAHRRRQTDPWLKAVGSSCLPGDNRQRAFHVSHASEEYLAHSDCVFEKSSILPMPLVSRQFTLKVLSLFLQILTTVHLRSHDNYLRLVIYLFLIKTTQCVSYAYVTGQRLEVNWGPRTLQASVLTSSLACICHFRACNLSSLTTVELKQY